MRPSPSWCARRAQVGPWESIGGDIKFLRLKQREISGLVAAADGGRRSHSRRPSTVTRRVSSMYRDQSGVRRDDRSALVHDAFGDIGATFRELEWKRPIFSGRVVAKTPNAS